MLNLSIRPLIPEDIPHLSRYWFNNTDENLLKMGVDKTKLPPQLEFDAVLQTVCETPTEIAKVFYMVWLIDLQQN